MRKMWRVIVSIVLTLILIGIIIIAVGFLTGADTARLLQTAQNDNLVKLVLRYFDWFYQTGRGYWISFFGA